MCTQEGIFLGIVQLACSAPEMRDPKDPKLPRNRPDNQKKSFDWIQQFRIVKAIEKTISRKKFLFMFVIEKQICLVCIRRQMSAKIWTL